MIYFDNSASTFVKPKEVIKAVNAALIHFTANPGRSGHKASIACAREIENARQNIANFFGLDEGQKVIFTNNCTEALNLAIFGAAKEGGHVVCTENEHNSVLRPLESLANEGHITYSIAWQGQKGFLSLNDIKKVVRDNTYMVICNHISNVNGDYAKIEEIGKFCAQNGILFLVDGAQSAGHEEIDMQKMNIDMLTFAGHKGFYSPQAIGGLVINKDITLNPIKFGGTGTNSLELFQPLSSPERYESGTISTPLILGLNAGVNFVREHFQEIRNRLDDLTTYVNYEFSKMPVEMLTEPDSCFGVLAFNIPGLHSSEVANILDEEYNICVRGGFHCAAKKHVALHTLDRGAVRVSFSLFNNYAEAQKLVAAVKHILKRKGGF